MLIVNLSHRFANLDKIQLSEAADEPFIAISKGHSSRKYFDELFAVAGITPKISLECDYLMRHEMVMSGRGIALATANTQQSNLISNTNSLRSLPLNTGDRKPYFGIQSVIRVRRRNFFASMQLSILKMDFSGRSDYYSVSEPF